MTECCPCTCNPKQCGHQEAFTVKKFPLQKTNMYVKTVQMNKNLIENFDTMQSQLQKKSPAGYCEKAVNHMLGVSNQRICRTRQRSNVGFYYRTVFPVQ